MITKRTPLLVEKEVAEQLGVTIRTLQRWRQESKGPKYCRLTRQTIRYKQEDIDQWIEESKFYGGMK